MGKLPQRKGKVGESWGVWGFEGEKGWENGGVGIRVGEVEVGLAF